MLQMLLEQRHRPLHGGVPQLIGGEVHEQGSQEDRQIFRPKAGATATIAIGQGGRIKRLTVVFDPVVNGTSSHSQGSSDLSDRLASADLQDRQGPAVETSIVSVLELAL
jgi:hypothetical protein